MDLEKRYQSLSKFLSKHQELLDKEILESFPTLPLRYKEWVSPLVDFSIKDLIRLENKECSELNLTTDHCQFIQDCLALSNLPKGEYPAKKIGQHQLKKMSQKKRHEIGLLQSQLEIDQSYIDLGSGAGHLSGVLLDGNQKTSLCIDQDSKIQDIGREKQKALHPRLQFKTLKFSSKTDSLGSSESTLIGLHCCGEFSHDLLKYAVRNKQKRILNYGCCYHKIKNAILPNSKFSNLSQHALTMAAKSYKTMTEDEFLAREKVKKYRYILHFLMRDKLGLEFRTLGNGSSEDYNKPFSHYCYKFVPETTSLSENTLESFYQDHQSMYQEYLIAGIIRSHLARPLEVFLNLERAIFLKNNGYEVLLEEVFDKSISPRNISILAYLKGS